MVISTFLQNTFNDVIAQFVATNKKLKDAYDKKRSDCLEIMGKELSWGKNAKAAHKALYTDEQHEANNWLSNKGWPPPAVFKSPLFPRHWTCDKKYYGGHWRANFLRSKNPTTKAAALAACEGIFIPQPGTEPGSADAYVRLNDLAIADQLDTYTALQCAEEQDYCVARADVIAKLTNVKAPTLEKRRKIAKRLTRRNLRISIMYSKLAEAYFDLRAALRNSKYVNRTLEKENTRLRKALKVTDKEAVDNLQDSVYHAERTEQCKAVNALYLKLLQLHAPDIHEEVLNQNWHGHKLNLAVQQIVEEEGVQLDLTPFRGAVQQNQPAAQQQRSPRALAQVNFLDRPASPDNRSPPVGPRSPIAPPILPLQNEEDLDDGHAPMDQVQMDMIDEGEHLAELQQLEEQEELEEEEEMDTAEMSSLASTTAPSNAAAEAEQRRQRNEQRQRNRLNFDLLSPRRSPAPPRGTSPQGVRPPTILATSPAHTVVPPLITPAMPPPPATPAMNMVHVEPVVNQNPPVFPLQQVVEYDETEQMEEVEASAQVVQQQEQRGLKLEDCTKEFEVMALRYALHFHVDKYGVFVLMPRAELGHHWISRVLMMRDEETVIRLAEFTGCQEVFSESFEQWLKTDFVGRQQKLIDAINAKCADYFQQAPREADPSPLGTTT